ncbi:MAG: hypothetical protein AAF495_12130 [Pseudomonadota bacterium]
MYLNAQRNVSWAGMAMFAMLAGAIAFTPASSQEPTPLTCDVGPVHKIYGATEWLVYSCNDQQTVVIVSAKGNPATPFYFVFYPKGNGYQLSGEGTGDKSATSAAFEELRTLNAKDVSGLIEQTRSN